VHGLVCFSFACYSAGTPSEDRFVHEQGIAPSLIAAEPFFSGLPQALLSHRNGGALAYIGHVERAWPDSITSAAGGTQIVGFINALSFILIGRPLGFALREFSEKYAILSTVLSALLERKLFGLRVPETELALTWISRNDAESYVLFGDPGVALRYRGEAND
jgi:hypothetical protein